LPDAGSCAQSTRLGFGSGMAPWGMQYVFEMGKTEIKYHTKKKYILSFIKLFIKLQWL